MKKILKLFAVIIITTICFTGCTRADNKPAKATDVDIVIKNTGRYQGLADNNFFEVKIDEVPKDEETKVFMITDKIRKKFEELKLKKDELIKLEYYKNKNGQLEVLDIERVIK